MYPYDFTDPTTHYLWDGFWKARIVIYEIMFFLLLMVVIISQIRVKRTKLKILIPSIALAIFIAVNAVDSAQGVQR